MSVSNVIVENNFALEAQLVDEPEQGAIIIVVKRVPVPADEELESGALRVLQELVKVQDEFVDALARCQVAEDAEVPAERFRLVRKLFQGDGFGHDGDLGGLGGKPGAEFAPFSLADQDDAIDRIPVDGIDPAINVVAVQAND